MKSSVIFSTHSSICYIGLRGHKENTLCLHNPEPTSRKMKKRAKIFVEHLSLEKKKICPSSSKKDFKTYCFKCQFRIAK